jgi:hypothetical protein
MQHQHDKPSFKDAPKVKRVCFRNDSDDNNTDDDADVVLHDATAVVVIEGDSKETFRLSVADVKARFSERLRAKWSSLSVDDQKDHLAEKVLSEQELAEELRASSWPRGSRSWPRRTSYAPTSTVLAHSCTFTRSSLEVHGALQGATTATTSVGVQSVESGSIDSLDVASFWNTRRVSHAMRCPRFERQCCDCVTFALRPCDGCVVASVALRSRVRQMREKYLDFQLRCSSRRRLKASSQS